MNYSIREQILQAIAGLCSKVPGLTAYRSRQAALSRTEGVAVIVQPEEEPSEVRAGPQGSGVEIDDLMFAVTLITRADDGAGVSADQVADPYTVLIHAALMADRTLGGLCAMIKKQSTRWEFEEADQTALLTEIRYTARYQIAANSLTTSI